MDVEAVALRLVKEADHFDRILGESILVGHRQAVAIDFETVDIGPQEGKRRQTEAALFMLFLKDGAENAG